LHATNGNRPNENVHMLRPQIQKLVETVEVVGESSMSPVIDTGCMLRMVNELNDEHKEIARECPQKWGICCRIKVKCKNSDYKSSAFKLFKEVDGNGPGRGAAEYDGNSLALSEFDDMPIHLGQGRV